MQTKEQKAAYAKSWNLRNPGYRKKWYEKNRGKQLASAKDWKLQNPGYAKAWTLRNPGYRKSWNEKNRERRLARARKWLANHPGYNKKYYEKNREACCINVAKYRVENRELIRATRKLYIRARRQKEPAFRVTMNLRRRMNDFLRGKNKSAPSMELIGINLVGLKSHLESLFRPGMSWENYGQWHVDHKNPCARFDLSDPKQQRQCFHYTNLQPLWAGDNIRKGARVG